MILLERCFDTKKEEKENHATKSTWDSLFRFSLVSNQYILEPCVNCLMMMLMFMLKNLSCKARRWARDFLFIL